MLIGNDGRAGALVRFLGIERGGVVCARSAHLGVHCKPRGKGRQREMRMKGLIVASAVVLAAAFFGIGHESQYVFTPEAMHRIAKQALSENPGNDPEVRARFPTTVLPLAWTIAGPRLARGA